MVHLQLINTYWDEFVREKNAIQTISHKINPSGKSVFLVVPLFKFSSKKEVQFMGILHELLQKGDAAQKYMQGSISMKIDSYNHHIIMYKDTHFLYQLKLELFVRE
ncbi:hypothetical protein MTR_5g014220 [Medicago truncatula]|uniref:Uncharacterized protein n=1 Tax=Medicago truncatula TaxID=3880 RepID=G7JZW4_MEDTR|nr:hypothetical protein MTR_5g014220 [Medicago truncatula]